MSAPSSAPTTSTNSTNTATTRIATTATTIISESTIAPTTSDSPGTESEIIFETVELKEIHFK